MKKELENNSRFNDEIEDFDLQTKSKKKLSEAFLFSLINTYGIIPINLLSTILIARVLFESDWGVVIYAHGLIQASYIFLIFFPPSFNRFVLYKIPDYLHDKKMGKVKSFILYGCKIKIIVSFIIIVLFLLLIGLSSDSDLSKLLTILSPLIFIFPIRDILNKLFMSMKKFKLIAIIQILQRIIQLIGIILLFLIDVEYNSKIFLYAGIILFSNIPPLIILIIYSYKEFKAYTIQKISTKEIKDSIIFGTYFSISELLLRLYSVIYLFYIRIYGKSEHFTQNNICNNLLNQSKNAFIIPTGPIYSDLVKKNKSEKISQLFNQQMKFLNIFSCFVIGFLYFMVGIYIRILYTPNYVVVIPILQSFVFVSFFHIIINSYKSVFSIIGLERIILFIDIITFFTLSILSFIGMYFFGFHGIILSKVIGYSITAFLFWYFGNKFLKKFNIKLLSIFRSILELIVLILIIQYIFVPLLSKLSFTLLENIALKILTPIVPNDWEIIDQIQILIFDSIVLLLFIIIYILYIILFRKLTKEDLKKIEKLNLRFPFKNKVFSLLDKILLSAKVKN